MTQRLWTQKKLDQLQYYYAQGMTLKALAFHFNGSVASINKTLTRYQLRNTYRKPLKHKKPELTNIQLDRENLVPAQLLRWLHNIGIHLTPHRNHKGETVYAVRLKPTIKNQLRPLLCELHFSGAPLHMFQVLVMANKIRAHFNMPRLLVVDVTEY